MRICVSLAAVVVLAACLPTSSDEPDDSTATEASSTRSGESDPGNTGVVYPGTSAATGDTTAGSSFSTSGRDSSTSDDEGPPNFFDVGDGSRPDLPPPFEPCPDGCADDEYCEYCESQREQSCSMLPKECSAAPTCVCLEESAGINPGVDACEVGEGGLLFLEYCGPGPPPP